MKPKIKLYNSSIAHCINKDTNEQGSFGTGDLCIPPTHFEWYRGAEQVGDICVITEEMASMVSIVPEKIKILLIIEPPLICPSIYEHLKNVEFRSQFDFILTYSQEAINLAPYKILPYMFGGCWIYPQDRKCYAKTKNISIIASRKAETKGHIMRHQAIAKFKDNIDGLFGNGYQFIPYKLLGLKDFRYQIVIENDPCDSMVSEKLIDCLVTGTIPIYCGSPRIGDYFNIEGILTFNDMDGLKTCIEKANEDFFKSKKSVILQNFYKAATYCVPEDDIFFNYLKPLLTEQ